MLLLVTALLLMPRSAEPETSRATIFSTIEHSEWCPAGNVRLELGTGEYVLTPRASRRVCANPDLVRPTATGRLGEERLAAVRQAYRRVQAEGLNDCRDGRRPQRIIVMNSGTPILVLTSGARTTAAPDEHSCWTGAALALQSSIDDIFRSRHQR
jgi:hypothetical protein